MKMNSTLANYEALVARRTQVRAEMEDIEQAYNEATGAMFDQIFDVLNPGEGMTARQISQTLGGVIDSREVASRLSRVWSGRTPMKNKYTHKREKVTTYLREVDSNGELTLNTKIYTRTEKVNVYRAQ